MQRRCLTTLFWTGHCLRRAVPLSIVTAIVAWTSLARAEGFKLSGVAGFGNSGAEIEGVTRTEDPLSFGMGVEYKVQPTWTAAVEHLRSFSGGATNVTVTGVVARHYLFGAIPTPIADLGAEIDRDVMFQKGYFPYVGVAVGFAQSSLPKKDANNPGVAVAKMYLAAKGGVDIPWKDNWGFRSEFSWSEGLTGAGTLRMVHIYAGIYYFL